MVRNALIAINFNLPSGPRDFSMLKHDDSILLSSYRAVHQEALFSTVFQLPALCWVSQDLPVLRLILPLVWTRDSSL
jgi:hypothetical protein